MTESHSPDGEAFAASALRWLGQIFDDRSMPWSSLRTATMIASAIQLDGRTIDGRAVAERARRVGCDLQNDVQALVRGGHLIWRPEAGRRVHATMKLRTISQRMGGHHG